MTEPRARKTPQTGVSHPKKKVAQSLGCKADEVRGEGAYMRLRDRTEGEENAADWGFGYLLEVFPAFGAELRPGLHLLAAFGAELLGRIRFALAAGFAFALAAGFAITTGFGL